MLVRIKTETGSMYDFGITSSKYSAFAQVILGGNTKWEIYLVSGKLEEESLEDMFLAEGWAKASRDIREYIGKLNIPKFINTMKRFAYPGINLEYYVANHRIPVS
jgi:hypothetical protein